jgi:hypothetical protein
MKFTHTLLSLLSSVNVQALPLEWQDMERDSRVLLTQSLELKGSRGETIRLPVDQVLTLEEVYPLSGLSVVNYVFRETPCGMPDSESEMELILPKGNPSGAEVGVTYLKGCALEIYVETKNLGQTSFFQSKSVR